MCLETNEKISEHFKHTHTHSNSPTYTVVHDETRTYTHAHTDNDMEFFIPHFFPAMLFELCECVSFALVYFRFM